MLYLISLLFQSEHSIKNIFPDIWLKILFKMFLFFMSFFPPLFPGLKLKSAKDGGRVEFGILS